MSLRIGVIADDFTGATDIAGFLVSAGLRTVQLNRPDSARDLPEDMAVDAVVISLKTRSIQRESAVEESLRALRILQDLDAERILFKYCSTFDSTAGGNIGPVADALLEALEESATAMVPGLPVNDRTVYRGHLFVEGVPLHESGMRHHPVTPMTDSNLMRLTEAQGRGTARNVPCGVVNRGNRAVYEAFQEAASDGVRYLVPDTLDDNHLDVLGEAFQDLRLVTGGSGIGWGIARALTRREAAGARHAAADRWRFTSGRGVVLSGSASEMTNRQVDHYRSVAPARALEAPRVLDDAESYRSELREWVLQTPPEGLAPLVYATVEPEQLKTLQRRHGAEELSRAIEGFFADLATELREHGVTRFIVAGGETSGAVTQALEVSGFEVGPQIAPGVPWTRSVDGELDIALKSGNFGDVEFFRAAQVEVTTHA
nr:3-oxo-tetronate kinase [Actinopolyspora halophila]